MAKTTKKIRRQKRKTRLSFKREKKGFSPDMLDGIWQKSVDIAADIEVRIVQLVNQHALKRNPNRMSFRRGLRKLVAMGISRFRRQAKELEAITGTVGKDTARKTLGELAKSAPKSPRNPLLGTTVRTPKSLQEAYEGMAPHILNSGSKLYDDIVRALVKAPPESDAARRRIAQSVLDDFQKRGITGFVDKSGRRWNIVSYVEMATRTATADMAMRAHIAEIQAAGLDLVRVTVMPNCHPFCQPFQGRLLSITGETEASEDGEPVVASIADAIARGFRHPNCRHTVKVHVPGVEVPDPELIDPGDYKATQDLRALERNVRKAKRAEAAAVTPERVAQARKEIRMYQRAIREHVAKTGVPRNRWREQINHAL